MDKYSSNQNILQTEALVNENFFFFFSKIKTGSSRSETPDNFKIVVQPMIQLKTSHRPPTSRRSGCHQKEIEPESERQGYTFY